MNNPPPCSQCGKNLQLYGWGEFICPLGHRYIPPDHLSTLVCDLEKKSARGGTIDLESAIYIVEKVPILLEHLKQLSKENEHLKIRMDGDSSPEKDEK